MEIDALIRLSLRVDGGSEWPFPINAPTKRPPPMGLEQQELPPPDPGRTFLHDQLHLAQAAGLQAQVVAGVSKGRRKSAEDLQLETPPHHLDGPHLVP